MRCHLVHGIRTSGSHQAPEALIPYLAPATVFYPDYGYELELTTRLINPMIVGAIEPYIEPGDIFIGHSNGCAIGYDLLQLGAPFAGVVFINAALERQITLPPWLSWCDVYYNQGDTITEAAQLCSSLGLVDPVWGEMGHAGYEGVDARVTSINCAVSAGLPEVNGHSDIFTKLAAWGPEILRRILAHSVPASPLCNRL
jgi:hypothetical protein